jgi:hypothetical protein
VSERGPAGGHSPRGKSGLTFVHWIGFAILGWCLYAGARELWPKAPSYGPDSAANLEVLAAPGFTVEVLPSHASLAHVGFRDFDVSPSGAVVVAVGRRVCDMSSGDDVFDSDDGVDSFAFAAGALVATSKGRVGVFDDGRFRSIGVSPLPGARVVGASDGSRFFLVRREAGDESVPAIVSMRLDEEPEAMTGSWFDVTAAGGDDVRMVYAARSALFEVVAAGEPSLLLELPATNEDIVGAAVAGETTYFSTRRVVFALRDGVALPLVIGLGGDLRAVQSAVYLLEARQQRVYRISPSTGKTS